MRERGSTRVLLSRGLALLLILASGLTPSRAVESYIFTEEPLVRVSPDLGEPDLFGYAAALHRVDDTGSADDFDHAIMNTKILVGAPSGTYPGGLSFSGLNDTDRVNRTGLVYMCPIVPGDCQALTGNGADNDIRMFDYQGNTRDLDQFSSTPDVPVLIEEKEGQFMGATIVSSGDHVLVCAPRWISLVTGAAVFDRTRGLGRCFFSGRNLMNFDLLRPCDGGLPTSEGDDSYCMAGTSAAVNEEESSTDFSLFLGAPPLMSSTGSVYEYSLMLDEEVDQDADPPNFNHGFGFLYGGFSIALGRIFNSDSRDLVSALPKNNIYRGSVRVFDVTSRTSQAQVDGEQIGEYFGWEVATADLNGDSYDEIIVGAPLYSTPDKIEKGRIFVYRNNADGTLDTENPIVIPGTVTKGRFGSAIANLGDINSDGFQDIAVSAPFEEDGMEDGAEGSVYIFLGSGDTYINRAAADGVKYDERITAFQVSQLVGLEGNDVLQSFGYSLSSGVDVDANFNNDLVIGGYKTQAIVVLRTMSIANITLSLATYPATLLEYTRLTCALAGEMFACFQLEISALFSGRGLGGRSLGVAVTVTENPVPSGPRLFFLNSSGDTESFEGSINFPTTNELAKKNITIYVQDDISDRRSPLSVAVTISPLERQPRKVNGSQDIIDLRDIPILNVLPQNNVKQELTLAGCESAICQPDLELILNETKYSGELIDDVLEVVANDDALVEITLQYRTLSDDASNSVLIFELPSNIFGPPTNEECSTDDNEVYTCLLEPIISSYEEPFNITLTIPLSDDLIGNEADFTLSIAIKSSDIRDTNTTNNVVNIPVSITASNEISAFTLTVQPGLVLYTNDDEDDFGDAINITVMVIGRGPTIIPDSKLTLYVPGQNELTGDNYFLYPTRISNIVGVPNDQTVNCEEGLNPEGLEEFNPPPRRRRRDTLSEQLNRMLRGGAEREKTSRKRQEDEEETVNCANDRASCASITCTIVNFRELSFKLETRVDQRFFRTQSRDFVFNAYAEFDITTDFFDHPRESETSASFSLKLQVVPEREPDTIPIWVFIVSPLAALIILVLFIILIFVLVVCLRRRTKKKIRRATERRRSLHAVATSSTAPGPVVTSLDEKPEKPELDDSLEKPPEREEEPDAGEAEPDAAGEDPDETEL